MFKDPVVEQYRLNPNKDGFTGVFTLAYPSKSTCIILGFTSTVKLKTSQIKLLIQHILKTKRTTVVFYRNKNNKEIIKKYSLLKFKKN